MAATVQKYLLEKRRRQRALRVGLIVFVFAGLVIGGVWALFFSDYFTVNDIVVSGAETLSADDIRQTAVAPAEGKFLWVFDRRNVFLFPVAVAREHVAAFSPKIESVEVYASVFSRTVGVRIVERHVFGIACGTASAVPCYYFDKTGTLFAKAPFIEGAMNLLVRDEGIADGSALPVSRYAGKTVQYFAVFKKELYDATGIALDSFAVTNEYGDAAAHSTGGFDILFNVGEEPAAQAEVVKALLREEIKDQISQLAYMDLRVENRAYYKLRQEPAVTSLETVHEN